MANRVMYKYILIVLFTVSCKNNIELKFKASKVEVVNSLTMVQNTMLNHKGMNVTNYIWDNDNILIINGERIGFLREDTTFIMFPEKEVINHTWDSFNRYINHLIFLKNQNIRSAFISQGTNNVYFSYRNQEFNAEVRLFIICSKTPINENFSHEEVKILDKSPPLYLIQTVH